MLKAPNFQGIFDWLFSICTQIYGIHAMSPPKKVLQETAVWEMTGPDSGGSGVL